MPAYRQTGQSKFLLAAHHRGHLALEMVAQF